MRTKQTQRHLINSFNDAKLIISASKGNLSEALDIIWMLHDFGFIDDEKYNMYLGQFNVAKNHIQKIKNTMFAEVNQLITEKTVT